MEILAKIKSGEIKIEGFDGLSPIAELGFRYELQDVAKPDRPEKEIFKLFKGRLLNSKVRLLCMNCGKYSMTETIKDIKELRCNHCQSKLIAVLKPHRDEAQDIVKKWLKGVELNDEEKTKLDYIRKSADLVIDHTEGRGHRPCRKGSRTPDCNARSLQAHAGRGRPLQARSQSREGFHKEQEILA